MLLCHGGVCVKLVFELHLVVVDVYLVYPSCVSWFGQAKLYICAIMVGQFV